MNKPVALTIAGSDPSGGAGIQADLKTFAALGIFGTSVVTALTAQNASRFEVFPVSRPFITAQLDAVFEAFDVKAVKIGMLANKGAVAAIIEVLKQRNLDGVVPVVLDPVIRASNGGVALDDEGMYLLRDELLPLTTLVKPNIVEAALLLGEAEADSFEPMQAQAIRLEQQGGTPVLLSGGHLLGPDIVDILCIDSKVSRFSIKKLDIPDIHGTGCTLTSAIAAYLAKGRELADAVDLARVYLAGLLALEPQLDRTGRARSVDHLALRGGVSQQGEV
jgi:hydroxymethylpyrimidine/phosphomethylpyrimidine kinase